MSGLTRWLHPRTASPSDADTDGTGSTDGIDQRRRRLVLIASAVLVVLTAGAIAIGMRDTEPDRPTAMPADTWAPYWALDDSLPTLEQQAGMFRELSPFWFTATGATSIEPDQHAPQDTTEQFLSIARAAGATIIPSISDGMDAGGMAAVLADPATRTAHVDALVGFAATGDYHGIDLDYEQFAFADDRSNWAATRPNWVSFVTELAGRLHADGRTLTVSIPPVYDDGRTPDSGYWVYDHAAIAPVVDRMRIMAYDYSTETAGPIAPLDWVQQVIDGVVETTGTPDKLVLGIPLYGYNWPVRVLGECPESEDVGRTSVTAREYPDLVQRRAAVPVYDEVVGEWTFTYDLVIDDGVTACTQQRQVWFVDAAGARERVEMALDAGFGGVALWALGYDDQSTWDALLPVLDPATATSTTVAG